MRASLLAAAVVLFACSRRAPPGGGVDAATKVDATVSMALPSGARPCGATGGPACFRFDTAEEAFLWVLGRDPRILAIGEAHAQRGTEAIASTTKRFTETLLPLLAPRASDVVVELWAPDPKCQKEVRAVASAQKPVTERQAATNQNEYVALGTRAKALGVTPWLLRPSCDDFAQLADAGADAVDPMLRLVKRLTQEKLTQLYEKNRRDAGGAPSTVVAYGGALHNDLHPAPGTEPFSFGPELDRLVPGRYVELDLIVPDYVKDTPAWQKLPWYPAWQADDRPRDKATIFALAETSFVLVLPAEK